MYIEYGVIVSEFKKLLASHSNIKKIMSRMLYRGLLGNVCVINKEQVVFMFKLGRASERYLPYIRYLSNKNSKTSGVSGIVWW